MTIILDMGGVIMNHNMPECIARFTDILGEEHMKTILGLASNGEGTADSLMEQYERGDISTDAFIDGLYNMRNALPRARRLLRHGTPCTAVFLRSVCN